MKIDSFRDKYFFLSTGVNDAIDEASDPVGKMVQCKVFLKELHWSPGDIFIVRQRYVEDRFEDVEPFEAYWLEPVKRSIKDDNPAHCHVSRFDKCFDVVTDWNKVPDYKLAPPRKY